MSVLEDNEKVLRLLHKIESIDEKEVTMEIENIKMMLKEIVEELSEVELRSFQESLRNNEEFGVQINKRKGIYKIQRNKRLKLELPFWWKILTPTIIVILTIIIFYLLNK